MIVFYAIERARSRRDALLPASFGALNLRAATAWPSTRAPLALRCGGSIYAVDATHDGAAAGPGHVLSVIFTTKNYILFGSKSAFFAVVPGRNHSARSKTSDHSSFSFPRSSLEAPACVTPEVGQALSI